MTVHAQVVTNIQISAILVPVFDDVLAASPSFAAQCIRIAGAPYVRVIVNPVMSASTTSRGTARTTMRRFSSGLLLADVEMPVPLTATEYAELFGHEFEHILEQIDGVDLEARHGGTRRGDPSGERRLTKLRAPAKPARRSPWRPPGHAQ